MRRALPSVLAGVAAVLTLAACGSAAGSGPLTWVPSPAAVGDGGGGGGLTPVEPVPTQHGGSAPGGPSGPGVPGGPGSQPSPSGTGKVDPLVVATHLRAPVGLTMMPDGTALVGERTTGRIVRVQPVAGRPVPTVRTLTGLDAAGDGGLLDLALSPTYSQDNLVYAYITTRTDNRVVDFTLNGPVTPVLTGIPKGHTGNTGRILFGPDGNLYVGTGDAGRPSLAASRTSLAGKILRIDPIGDPTADDPMPGSAVWSTGHSEVSGLCSSPRSDSPIDVERGPAAGPDEVNVLSAGGDYGYPTATASSRAAAAPMPAGFRAPGGCAVQAGRLWVTSLDGRALLSAPLAGRSTAISVGKLVPVLKGRYGRLRTVVAAPDGALWLTTSNRDGKGSPVAADERVIRYIASSNASNSPV
jgi:glucose/arabinose dehydrogenase